MGGLAETKRRIVEHLKRADGTTAAELAGELGMTDTAVRQHLDALEAAGLVARRTSRPLGRGRPPLQWALTPEASGLFPDRHGELAVGLLDAVRAAHGDDGLDRVLAARAEQQRRAYGVALRGADALPERLRRLAELRTMEGYAADAHADGDVHVLVEHHCPVGDAARSCPGLCRAELELFRTVLGAGVTVERTQHVLAGDARCSYRVTPVTTDRPAAARSGPPGRRATT